MKRVFCLILALMLVMLSVTPALAAENESSVMPRYSYIGKIYAGLQIGSLGLSACQANCYIENGDHVVMTVRLRQYDGSSWTTVKTWTATDNSYAAISKNYAVPSGYTYCLRVSCNVYDASGILVETGTCYSNQVTY